MDSRELWARYRHWLCAAPELGFRLDLSRSGVSDELLERMEPGLGLAFASMRKLEEGAIANPDEGRMVGHYWLRRPELAPDRAITAAIRQNKQALLEFSAAVHAGTINPQRSERFRRLLVVGIGGSALGAVRRAGAGRNGRPRQASFPRQHRPRRDRPHAGRPPWRPGRNAHRRDLEIGWHA